MPIKTLMKFALRRLDDPLHQRIGSGCTPVASSGSCPRGSAGIPRPARTSSAPLPDRRELLRVRNGPSHRGADDLLRQPLADSGNASSGADAVLRSTPTAFTQPSTTASSERAANALRHRADTGPRRWTSDRSSPARPADLADAAQSRWRRAPSVEIGKLLAGESRRRIDGRTRFRHHDLVNRSGASPPDRPRAVGLAWRPCRCRSP